MLLWDRIVSLGIVPPKSEEENLSVVAMKNLLESGVHFGHQTKRWDPRMKKFIFAERNGIHIIDLQKTIVNVRVAYDMVRHQAELEASNFADQYAAQSSGMEV